MIYDYVLPNTRINSTINQCFGTQQAKLYTDNYFYGNKFVMDVTIH